MGYQFPGHRRKDDFDTNWLSVRADVQWREHQWSFIDPRLTTHELAELIQWLERMPRPGEPTSFIEPLLQFEAPDDSPPWSLTVTLWAEAVPERVLPRPDRWTEGIKLNLDATETQFSRMIGELREDFQRFPPR